MNNKLLFFSDIKIMFFEFFLKIFKKNELDKVSIVLPDFEMTIKRTCDKFIFFLKLMILFSSRLLKK